MQKMQQQQSAAAATLFDSIEDTGKTSNEEDELVCATCREGPGTSAPLAVVAYVGPSNTAKFHGAPSNSVSQKICEAEGLFGVPSRSVWVPFWFDSVLTRICTHQSHRFAVSALSVSMHISFYRFEKSV